MFIVSGATGHIGNNTVRYLLEQNESVRVLVRKKDVSLDNLDVDIKVSQTFDEQFLDTVISENDVIIHTAGYINLFNQDKMETFRTNVQLTKRIVNMCLKKHCRLVYISSVDVISKPKVGLVREPSHFTYGDMKNSYYQKSKWLATKFVHEQMKQGLDAVILYPSAVIGPHDYKPSQVGKEIKHIINHKLLFLLKGGYNFIDVRDVAKAICLAAIQPINDHIILSGYHQSIKALYASISRMTNRKKIMIKIPIWLAYITVIFYKRYSNIMIKSLTENDHYDDAKRKVHLFDELIPFDQTLKDTITFLAN